MGSNKNNTRPGSSNLLLESIFESALDGIILIDSRGIIRRANQSVLDLFGYDLEEIVGQNVSMLMPNPHHDQHDQYLKNYLSTGEKKIIGIGREVFGLRKDNTQFPFYLAVNTFDFDGKTYFTGIIHDLSEQREAQEKLKEYAGELEKRVEERTKDLQLEIEKKQEFEIALLESQKMYKIISKNFPSGTINVFDQDLNYLFVQGKELDELRISTEDLLGSSYIDRLDHSIREEVEKRLRLVFDGAPQVFEIDFKGNTYLLRAEPLSDLDEEISQILVVETNITARKEVEIEMQKALEKEKELNEMKSRFVSMASHEFKTPLSAILSSAALIARYPEAEDQSKREKHVERIRSNVQNLNIILEDFLSLEKLNEGVIHPLPMEINVADFLHGLAEEVKELYPRNSIMVTEAASVTITTDKNILKNVFNNLISNAVKYGKQGDSIELVVCEIDENTIQMKVVDHGIGIPKRDQRRIFSRFFRASNATHIEGTGLGLNIVKRYIDLLQGDIRFESEPNRGTTFYIDLPKFLKE